MEIKKDETVIIPAAASVEGKEISIDKNKKKKKPDESMGKRRYESFDVKTLLLLKVSLEKYRDSIWDETSENFLDANCELFQINGELYIIECREKNRRKKLEEEIKKTEKLE